MKRKPYSRIKRTTTKSVLRLPDLEHAKAAVLNSLTSLDAQRGYRHAIDEFIDWYSSEPRLALNRIVVLYRSHLPCFGGELEQIQFLLGHVRFKRQSTTLGANNGFDQPSMIALASSRATLRLQGIAIAIV
jgi:hypothetical protein